MWHHDRQLRPRRHIQRQTEEIALQLEHLHRRLRLMVSDDLHGLSEVAAQRHQNLRLITSGRRSRLLDVPGPTARSPLRRMV